MKTIVILGAGFGGVRCALTLEKLIKKANIKNIRVILIDKNRYHTFIPALYEVASAAPQVSEDTLYHRVNILIKHLFLEKRVEFIKAEAASIDIHANILHFADGNGIDFDYLVLALGSQTNFSNIEGLKNHALDLKDFISALKIRRAVKLADEMPKEIIIGSGGATGVELAAELSTCFKNEYPRITIIQRDERILSAFPEKVSRLALARLKQLGVRVRTGNFIKNVTSYAVVLQDGSAVPYERLFWAGGIMAHPLVTPLPFQKEKGFLKVDQYLHPLKEGGDSQENIFVVGDTSVVYDKKAKIVPLTAQKAIAEGEQVAYNLSRILSGKERKVVTPQNVQFIIPVGGKWAITKLNGFIWSGFFGWVLKNLVELKYMLSILPWHKAIIKWLAAMVTFSKND